MLWTDTLCLIKGKFAVLVSLSRCLLVGYYKHEQDMEILDRAVTQLLEWISELEMLGSYVNSLFGLHSG